MAVKNKYRNRYISTLHCNTCGTAQDIVRPEAKRRGKGHTKHMWCFRCEDTTAHTESGE